MAGRQLTLDLALRPALAREDFLVSPANAAAVALVDQWPNWPTHGAVIVGQPGSGKSHLASVWQQRSHAKLRPAAALSAASVPEDFASGCLVVEDAGEAGLDERALFHLLNLARQEGGYVLLTSTRPVAAWPIALPDLRSRLQALPEAAILPPDDALLRGVLVKHFADRQITVSEAIISYILTRMPRSMAALRQIVQEIDTRALAEKVEITRPFVARVLAEAVSPGLFPQEE